MANLGKAFGERSVEWYDNFYIKASAYECQAEFFFCFGSDLNAKAAFYTFAGFVNYVGMLNLLAKQISLAFISVLEGVVLLAEFSQLATVGFAAVTVQTTGRFLFSLLIGKSFTFP